MSDSRPPATGNSGPKTVLSRKAPTGTREERRERGRSRTFSNEGPRRTRLKEQPEAQKLQKVLAANGRGSRREIELWISAGRVCVNGEPAHLGQRVTAADRIEIDGQPVSSDQGLTSQIIVLNKAGGLVCSRRDPEKRGTIFDTLPKIPGSRWVTVGRLDVQTTGLLLVTNDGGLAHRMMHPSTGLDREYAVRVNAKLEDNAIARLKTGVEIEGQTMRFSDIRYYNGSENNFWYHVALTEGRNREVRRLFESAGCLVSRLKRVRYGPVVLPSWLTVGQWASLRQEDIKLLYRMLGLPRPEQTGPKLKRSKVAKTSCLIPYPKLSAAKSSAKEKIPSVMALSLATDLDFAVDNARDGGGKKIKVDSASGTAGHGFQRQPRPALGKAEIKSTKKTAQASSGKTKKTKDGGIKKVSTKRGRKKAVDNRAGSEQKKDGIAKARGKGNAAKSRSRGGTLT